MVEASAIHFFPSARFFRKVRNPPDHGCVLDSLAVAGPGFIPVEDPDLAVLLSIRLS
jgi:hypothetical protein